MPPRERRQIIAQGLKSLCENLILAQFCSARLSSGHWGRGDTKNARLKDGRYKTMPILSSHTNSKAQVILAFDVAAEEVAEKSSGTATVGCGATVSAAKPAQARVPVPLKAATQKHFSRNNF
jgi:hypothetical protein